MSEMNGNQKPYKAASAFVLSMAVLVWSDLQGKEQWSTLSFQDWLTILVPAFLITAGVWAVPNPPRR